MVRGVWRPPPRFVPAASPSDTFVPHKVGSHEGTGGWRMGHIEWRHGALGRPRGWGRVNFRLLSRAWCSYWALVLCFSLSAP